MLKLKWKQLQVKFHSDWGNKAELRVFPHRHMNTGAELVPGLSHRLLMSLSCLVWLVSHSDVKTPHTEVSLWDKRLLHSLCFCVHTEFRHVRAPNQQRVEVGYKTLRQRHCNDDLLTTCGAVTCSSWKTLRTNKVVYHPAHTKTFVIVTQTET